MRSITVIATLGLVSVGIAQPRINPMIAAEMQKFKLTLDVLHIFDAINTALDGLPNHNAIFTGRYQAFQAVMAGTSKSINETAEPFAKNYPAAAIVIRKAGFSTQQYLLVYYIVLEAYLSPSIYSGGELPPGLSRQNVDLLRPNSDLTRPIIEHLVKQEDAAEGVVK